MVLEIHPSQRKRRHENSRKIYNFIYLYFFKFSLGYTDLHPQLGRTPRPRPPTPTHLGAKGRQDLLLRQANLHNGRRSSAIHQTASVRVRGRSEAEDRLEVHVHGLHGTVPHGGGDEEVRLCTAFLPGGRRNVQALHFAGVGVRRDASGGGQGVGGVLVRAGLLEHGVRGGEVEREPVSWGLVACFLSVWLSGCVVGDGGNFWGTSRKRW